MHIIGRWSVALTALAIALVGLGTWNPWLTTVAILSFFIVALALYLTPLLPRLFLILLGGGLLGYAFLGRGFAYLGVAPLYIGEALLALGLLTLVLTGGLERALRAPISWLLLGFMGVGAFATVPYIPAYGLDSFRDAVTWGYGVFALLVATFLLRTDLLAKVVHQYGRWLPWFLLWTPLAFTIYRLVPNMIPHLPGSEIALVNTKGGDIAVHLAGILIFLILGLHQAQRHHARAMPALQEWACWLLWLLTAILAFSLNRGGMLSVLIAATVVMVLRPMSRWGKLIFVSLVMLTSLVALDVEIDLGRSSRPLSVEGIMQNFLSVMPGSELEGRTGTTAWRLSWWDDIITYTVFGDYFWTGKGFGINLANADGYQVASDESVRSPHNGHLTILARSGVPGALAWLLLQGAFFLSLLRAYFRARGAGREWWAKLNLWVLAYWTAFMVNGSFDVFLEGPQGGIWFWSLLGFGIAILEIQRRNHLDNAAWFENRQLR